MHRRQADAAVLDCGKRPDPYRRNGKEMRYRAFLNTFMELGWKRRWICG